MKSTKLALLKALFFMMNSSSNLCSSSLSSAGIAARIMHAHDIPFQVQTGYSHLPGFKYSIPHVWLVTRNEAVTDITFSGPERKVLLLGQPYAFHEPSAASEYDLEPKFPILPGAMSIEKLREAASDLEVYMEKAPDRIKDAVKLIMEKAMDGNTSCTLQVEK